MESLAQVTDGAAANRRRLATELAPMSWMSVMHVRYSPWPASGFLISGIPGVTHEGQCYEYSYWGASVSSCQIPDSSIGRLLLISPRLNDHNGCSSPSRLRRRVFRISGLALGAAVLAGAVTGIASAPGAASQANLGATLTASVRTQAHTPNPRTVNVRHASLAYLQAQARNHTMSSLASHQATSVRASAVPLLRSGAEPTASAGSPAAATAATAPVYGMDVSAFQGAVNWSAAKSDGAQFAYIKATEGSYYVNTEFTQQYDGSYDAGLVRGVYAFAIPNYSSGVTQADYLLAHGGGWSADGKTLPAALDIEYNPYAGGECFGLSQASMRSWITSFLDTYHSRTTRWPVIYSTTNWWSSCTGNWSGPSANDPLWIACYCSSAGTLPAGYGFYTFWQFADSGTFPGDQDVFNGDAARLTALAKNT
jgi:GH25 family lysozyme M1 (1,4-beta-N-acetylmuramidase)